MCTFVFLSQWHLFVLLTFVAESGWYCQNDGCCGITVVVVLYFNVVSNNNYHLSDIKIKTASKEQLKYKYISAEKTEVSDRFLIKCL